MNANLETVLNDLVNVVENLTISVDALEAVLIRKGQLRKGDIATQSPQHFQIVASKLAVTRRLIAGLTVAL